MTAPETRLSLLLRLRLRVNSSGPLLEPVAAAKLQKAEVVLKSAKIADGLTATPDFIRRNAPPRR